jgi:hypothetical protein
MLAGLGVRSPGAISVKGQQASRAQQGLSVSPLKPVGVAAPGGKRHPGPAPWYTIGDAAHKTSRVHDGEAQRPVSSAWRLKRFPRGSPRIWPFW